MFLTGAAVAAAITFAVVFDDNDSSFGADDGAGVRQTIRGDSSEFSLREAGLTIKASWRGDFDLDKSGNKIAAVDEYLNIEIDEDGESEGVRFEKDGRELKTTYWRDGEEPSEGEASDEDVENLVLRFLRASAFDAEDRVDALLTAGGSDTVLEEIKELKSDYAVRRYTAALSEKAELSDQAVAELINRLMELKGNHDLARSLESVIRSQSLDGATYKSILIAAERIEGDYDKRRIITAIAAKDLDSEGFDAWSALFEDIESDHDLRVAAEALLENSDVNAEHADRLLLLSADLIGSDHDKRLVLTKASSLLADNNDVADAWLSAFEEIGSDYDKRIAIEAASKYATDDADLQTRLRAAAATIDSDHERNKALKALD